MSVPSIDPASGPWARFEGCATIVIGIAVLVVFVVAVVVMPIPFAQGPVPASLSILVVGLAASLPLLALTGLVTSMPWRIEVAVIALWFLVFTGVLDVVAGLAKGTITFPLLAIGAAIALSRRPTTPRTAGHGGIQATAVLLGTAALIAGPLTGAALRPGSPLVAAESALELGATVDCSPGGAVASPPSTIGIATSWTWHVTEPLAWGSDAVLIEWQMVDERDEASGSYRVSSLELPEGAVAGQGPKPASDAIDAELAELGPDDGAVSFWLDLGARGMGDGGARVTLAAPVNPPDHGSVFVKVTYVHRDAWQVSSFDDTTTCFW